MGAKAMYCYSNDWRIYSVYPRWYTCWLTADDGVILYAKMIVSCDTIIFLEESFTIFSKNGRKRLQVVASPTF